MLSLFIRGKMVGTVYTGVFVDGFGTIFPLGLAERQRILGVYLKSCILI